jgi:hypothetical protein
MPRAKKERGINKQAVNAAFGSLNASLAIKSTHLMR